MCGIKVRAVLLTEINWNMCLHSRIADIMRVWIGGRGGVGVGRMGPPPENFGKSRMQERPSPSTTFLRLIFIFLVFINQFSLFFFLLFYKIFRLFFIF